MNSRVGKALPPPPHYTENETLSATNAGRYNARLFLASILWILAFPLAAQNQRFDWGNFSFSLSPKVLKDGSITDISLGYQYAASNATGNLRLRFSNATKNEPLDEMVPDSLNAIEDSTFAVFLTPFEYAFFNSPRVQLK
ncbi:MAG: hypothetical protein LBE74_01665, partial [Treponema sp.]|nr:hypothetical protein [Treponema sp.]